MSSQFNDWKADDESYVTTILATVVFKSILQGVLFVATWRYFSTASSRDGIMLRILVGVVMALEVLHTSITVSKLYLVGIERVFWMRHWLNPTDTTVSGIICFTAQSFFAHRCWRLTNKSIAVLCLVLFTLFFVFAGDFGLVVNEWLAYRRIIYSTPLLRGLIFLWGCSSIIFEILVTTVFFRFLWKSRTGIRGLDKIILRLFTMAFESSLPCLIFLFLINLTVLFKNVSSNFFAYSTASLYGLSLMASLNCREKIQDKLVQYRQDGAELRFSESAQVHNTTQSQIFSEVANASRRASTAATAVGSDPANHYRRPSILSFVKEVM